jgi:hypothetical protein
MISLSIHTDFHGRPLRSCITRGQLTVWIIEGDFYMSFNKPNIRCPRREEAEDYLHR